MRYGQCARHIAHHTPALFAHRVVVDAAHGERLCGRLVWHSHILQSHGTGHGPQPSTGAQRHINGRLAAAGAVGGYHARHLYQR